MPLARDRVPALLALLVFGALLILVGARHEPWFDEAQAWLIARDNSPWSLVTHGVRYEGTPALWHLTLWIAQRLGLPYAGLWLVSSVLALAGAFIMLTRSPFPMAMRIGLIFSYFFAYQYAVVARSYALDLLFMPLLAALFAERAARPRLYAAILTLVANTNAHSFMLSAVLAGELLWTLRSRVLARERGALVAIALYGVGALAAVVQAAPPPDINFLIARPGDSTLVRGALVTMEAFIDRGDVWAMTPPGVPARIVGGLLTLLVLVPAAWLCAAAGRVWLAAALFGVLVGFSIVKYGNYWHAGILFLTFVFCLWISWPALGVLSTRMRTALAAALVGLLAVQVFETAAAEARDVAQAYSGAPAAAHALVADLKAHPSETIGVAGFKAFAMEPWFAGDIFTNYRPGGAPIGYYLWRRSERPIPGLSEPAWRETAGAGYDRLLLSTFNVMGWNGPARYIADAHNAGYCPTALFPGAMVWKTYALETDDIMLFDRCAWPAIAQRRSP